MGEPGGEGEGHEAADGGTDDCAEDIDAQRIDQQRAGVHLIGGGDGGEGGAPGFTGYRIGAGGTGGAVAAAEIVWTNDKEAVGVDGFSWADHFGPPALVEFGLPQIAKAGDPGIGAGGVVGAGEGVEEEDGVRAVRVELAPGLEGEGDLREGTAIAEGEGASGFEKLGAGFSGHGVRFDHWRTVVHRGKGGQGSLGGFVRRSGSVAKKKSEAVGALAFSERLRWRRVRARRINRW